MSKEIQNIKNLHEIEHVVEQVVVTFSLGIIQEEYTGPQIIPVDGLEFEGIKITNLYAGTFTECGIVGVGVIIDNIQWAGQIDLSALQTKADAVLERFVHWLESVGVGVKDVTPTVMVTSNIW